MTTSSRGTVLVEIERCKGCELCIPACPPQVLSMSSSSAAAPDSTKAAIPFHRARTPLGPPPRDPDDIAT